MFDSHAGVVLIWGALMGLPVEGGWSVGGVPDFAAGNSAGTFLSRSSVRGSQRPALLPRIKYCHTGERRGESPSGKQWWGSRDPTHGARGHPSSEHVASGGSSALQVAGSLGHFT